MTYTQGEWKVSPGATHTMGVRTAGGFICFMTDVFRYPGQYDRYEQELAERRADAQLIAAAPALLAALKGLVECPSVKGSSAHIRDQAQLNGRPDEYAAARAAIALAGEK